MRELLYRPAALADLDAIYDWIETDNPRRAASYVQDIRIRCRTLLEHPQLGSSRDDIKPGLRIYPMFRRIVVCYRLTETAIVVMRVFSGGQDYATIIRHSDEGRP